MEPWIQWVSFHNGVSAKHHKVRRFYEDELQPNHQFWSELNEQGVKASVWNTFNSTSSRATVYFPLAWNQDQILKPNELQNFYNLNHYTAINYTQLSFFKLTLLFVKFQFLLIRTLGFSSDYLKDLWCLIFSTIMTRKILAPAGYLEYCGVKLWSHYSKKEECRLNIVCIHLMAHLQHNIWINKDAALEENSWKYGSMWLDKILKVIHDHEPDGSFVMLNAFSQSHYSETKIQNYIYKLKEPKKFLSDLGVSNCSVHFHMTSEYTLEFKLNDEAIAAASILKNIKIEDEKIFEVIEYGNSRLYFRLSTYKSYGPKTSMKLDTINLRFLDYFARLGLETGSHSNKGSIFSNTINFPKSTELSQIKKYIVEFFN